jgi:hypothetical protein
LGLLLPGVLFVYFCNVLNTHFNVFLYLITSERWEVSLATLLCFALVAGAMLYSINYFLVKNLKWYGRLFGMYKHVADLNPKLGSLHKFMNSMLNRKAVEMYRAYYTHITLNK